MVSTSMWEREERGRVGMVGGKGWLVGRDEELG